MASKFMSCILLAMDYMHFNKQTQNYHITYIFRGEVKKMTCHNWANIKNQKLTLIWVSINF